MICFNTIIGLSGHKRDLRPVTNVVLSNIECGTCSK